MFSAINLLPPKEKKKIELAELGKLVGVLTAGAALFLILSIIFLLHTRLYLYTLLKEQSRLIDIRRNDEKVQRVTEIEEDIEQYNQWLEQVADKQAGMILWTSILRELSEIAPTGVSLTDFSYYSSLGQITINGYALDRDRLLSFQASLEESPYFISVDAPLTNLIRHHDVQFSFTLNPAITSQVHVSIQK